MINIFSRYKFIFYLSNFVLIFLYLFPGSILGHFLYNDVKKQPQITPDFIISTNHLYAFLVFSAVGFLTFKKLTQFKKLTIYLVFLSIILEITHLFIPERGFEFSDLFGNLIGVVIIIIISFFLKKNEKY
ncbi:VanZ family protein [Candidatus Pelagibacter sp.]|uniref:VanZ family protein n=1 Tax=Candidatus Pelagibacter sp. TaxID=2024849 RepID=UPI003F846347